MTLISPTGFAHVHCSPADFSCMESQENREKERLEIVLNLDSPSLFAGGIVNNTLRPPVPGYCDSEWKLLMEQCWAADPIARPSFTEITRRLRVMSAACRTKPQVQGQSQVPK